MNGRDELARCRWPELGEPYATALREAVDYIFGRWRPLGVIAAGTIVRGTPSPNSDLDLYVLHAAPERQRVQRFFRGVPAEMFVNPPERVERYFESDKREGRLIAAHMVATGFVVYQEGLAVERLRTLAGAALASTPDPSPAFLTQRRYTVATWLEDAEDVAGADPELCAMLLCRAVEGALEYRFWTARRWQPRYKDTLAALETLDRHLAQDARAFYRAADAEERLRLARSIVTRTVGADRFFEWESPVEALTS